MPLGLWLTAFIIYPGGFISKGFGFCLGFVVLPDIPRHQASRNAALKHPTVLIEYFIENNIRQRFESMSECTAGDKSQVACG